MGFFPGAGLALFFLGVEQGTALASQSALWSIPGTPSMLFFCFGYRLCNTFQADKSILVIALFTASGLSCQFLSAYLLQYLLPEHAWARFTILLIFIALFALLLGRKAVTTIELPTLTAANKKIVLIARAGFASAINTATVASNR